MAEDPRDKLKEARDLFARSRDAFYEGHRKGMDALKGSEGEEMTDRLDEAIRMEGRAICQMSEAVELHREAVAEQQGGPDSAGDARRRVVFRAGVC